MANMEIVFARLISKINEIGRSVSQLSARNNNLIREAVVKSVNFETGMAIVDAHGIESKEVPWMQQAGAINEWTPLSEGQRVMLFSPSGDMGRAFILPGGFTDEVKAPHNKGAEKRTTIGNCVITQSASGFVMSIGGTTFSFTADGFAQTGGNQTHEGGSQSHNGQNVGSTHVHGGIFPGGADTSTPH
jgi:hypothetical protein